MDGYHLDLIVLAGFLVAIPAAMTEKYEGRIINIHPSLIPSFCGKVLRLRSMKGLPGAQASQGNRALCDSGMDTGPIILQKAVEVKKGDTPEALQKRVMEEAEWVILPQAIHMIANQLV